MISVHQLVKEYTLVKRDPGLRGAMKSLINRQYEKKTAVDGISFQIEKGEMVGYIGANGAGKSTTIKMLTGILTPSSGEVRVNGIIPYKRRKENAKQIGAVFGQRTQLFWDIPVRESFQLLKEIYEVPEEQFSETMELFTEVLQLDALLPVPVRQLSLGQKMRCELAAAFIHRPEVVYLDEPTIGLDVAVKVKIRKFIREMNAKWGTTVLLTTHDMQDIEEICSRIIIIDGGAILYDGSLREIKDRFSAKREIHFELDSGQAFALPDSISSKAEAVLENGEGTEKVIVSFSHHELKASEVISAVLQLNKITDLSIQDPKIETIVEEIYNRGL
ncbi:ATP-binding cassette domain-containing protein [Bacillus mangrovi]|uniref:ATP-binding cassette domain-containing protein n=1 Tax=Metabacillus mangrovi TaxID=1491830 RepID=A0A7X2S1E0_9BACI|nr:ATP-binding cassette domain-containing protein [Metabacillus mangrovi]MTH52023.1 ATP-binding cassette domain-containing protein [Metabacillus mangrovi]